MVSCASLSSRLVALFGGLQFHHMILKHGAKRYPKAYSSWDHSWTEEDIFFVNRMKGNADYATLHHNPVLNDGQCPLTNHLKFGTKTLSAIYKERWQKGFKAGPEDEDPCRNWGERSFLSKNDALFFLWYLFSDRLITKYSSSTSMFSPFNSNKGQASAALRLMRVQS